jgi:transcription elongation factor Elf1
MQDGAKIHVGDMTDSHLKNCLNLVYDKNTFWKQIFEAETKKRAKKRHKIKNKPNLTSRSCPFCGGKTILTKCGDQKEFWVVLCSECYETPVDLHEAKINSKQAIRVYNERADFATRIIYINNKIIHKD